jgi:hypothetical protein
MQGWCHYTYLNQPAEELGAGLLLMEAEFPLASSVKLEEEFLQMGDLLQLQIAVKLEAVFLLMEDEPLWRNFASLEAGTHWREVPL